jgi:membrane-bound lytic murein transglycosylase A
MVRPFRHVAPPLVDIGPEDAPVFVDDLDRESLRAAIARSIAFYDRRLDATFVVGGRPYSGADFVASLRGFVADLEDARDPASLDRAVRSDFRILRGTGTSGHVLFTGYYAPLLRGSRERGGLYQFPVYARPDDLVTFDLSGLLPGCACARGPMAARLDNGTLVPYYTRAEIERDGVLSGHGLEVVWVDDPIALFFLHIQGSGQVILPDGERLQLNFAGTNGRPFRSLGRLLADRGALRAGGTSMPVIRAYLREHPMERDELLHQNERYTFFRIAETGPVGSTGVELTAGRSIAADPAIFPPGALAYIRTRTPLIEESGHPARWTPLRRFVLNQDSGIAIAGPGRVDIFFGSGDEAEQVAGGMAADGDLYFLVPRIE